jgi:glutamate-1-semialdehyde aminotransferase/spore coat polysaccharide biosynthesis protein SpsF (cytidylyltransferase family)
MNKKRTIAIAQARMGSTRLPGKVMTYMGGKPVLRWTYDALKAAQGIDEIVIATSTRPEDDAIAKYCAVHNINCFRGNEIDVLERFYQCSVAYGAEVILRLTCDCPFIDHNVVTEVVRLRAMKEVAYASNIDPPTYPDGLDTECFTFDALFAAYQEATRPSDRDCVTQYIVRNRDRFPAANLTCPLPGLEKERWVLDTKQDLEFCCRVAMYVGNTPTYLDILRILDIFPDFRDINKSGIRNERFYEGIHTEPKPVPTFKRSEEWLAHARRLIPFGAQTFSKSHLQFPPDASPLYVSHADGARVFDVDGNDYVDLVNAILPVVLGYRDPDVDRAIRDQLDNGISFSLSTKLEMELAENLHQLIPCAEMVKFGKSGTDVTTAAVRAARAHTGRSNIIMTGYHGWADWSMCNTARNRGIIYYDGIENHCQRIDYGNFASFEAEFQHWGSTIAAIIVEPEGNAEFLRWLRLMCDKHGIVLIFDEVITGFRWAMGGAQKYYNVTPDMATFGKAMANGMPLSAVVGKREIMKVFEPPNNIFYSGTMFGETLSLAASLATIKKMQRENVIQHLWKVGADIDLEMKRLLDKHGLNDVVELNGEFPKRTVTFKDISNATSNQLRTVFMQMMIESGVLIIGSNNVSWAIKDAEMKRIFSAYEYTFDTMKELIDNNAVADSIWKECEVVSPLRKVY